MCAKRGFSLGYQFERAINDCFTPGVPKEKYEGNPFVYSYTYRHDLIKTGYDIAHFIESEFQNVKWVKDIDSDKLLSFVASKKADECSSAYFAKLKSHIHKLQYICNHRYNLKNDVEIKWKGNIDVPKGVASVRAAARMSNDDLRTLKAYIIESGTRSEAAIAIELTEILGCRVEESPCIRVKDISFESGINKYGIATHGTVCITNGKGGLIRNIDIFTAEDVDRLRSFCIGKSDNDTLVTIKKTTINN